MSEFRWGSEQHKMLFCRTLLDTFNPYKPAVIDWPELDSPARSARPPCRSGISPQSGAPPECRL